jgi:hypothetical protein
MYVRIDASHIPPVVELCEVENLTSFSVVLSAPPHVWIEPQTITELAGRTDDPAWLERFATMVTYARRHDWVDDQGRIRAHLDVR